MSDRTPVRVFIGSGEASRLERKVLQYSLRKNSKRELEIYVFNGTHNAVEPPAGEPLPAPMSLAAKYTNVTEFSNYRFLIPQLCNHQGRAIYLDSDMVALGDIGELFDADLGGADFLAKADSPDPGRPDLIGWGMSVSLYDCSKARFDLDRYIAETKQGLYTYQDLHWMTPKFLALHPFRIGKIDPNWNVFDRHDADTKLIHYTDLFTQPWKFARHPYGDLWFRYFAEARAAGVIDETDIALSKARGYVRQDVTEGNNPPRLRPAVKRAIRRLLPRRK